ncbi:uncharacterized protein METZ01_LOCUS102390 [marine metagenome]|uniref:Uncharacterized protein n=1 Tax=marine metagenome TaxID=408172 RepID=A0A381WAF3_9ZZZZ
MGLFSSATGSSVGFFDDSSLTKFSSLFTVFSTLLVLTFKVFSASS